MPYLCIINNTINNNNMTKLKTFLLSGFGNYSETHGWDNGIDVSIQKEVTFDEAQAAEDHDGEPVGLPSVPTVGVYFNCNEYGGSRNLHGYVIAESEDQAAIMVAKIADAFPVTEYEPQD
jgi:hypothetical protein